MKMPQYAKWLIEEELERAVKEHGARFDSYGTAFMVLASEIGELANALYLGDVDGEHGIHREAAQVAAVCIKILGGVQNV
jgi:hypothetical protein